MRYRNLISNTPSVSEIGLGAWQLGANTGWSSVSETDAIKMVHASLDEGINFFDTAPNYGLGTSEERLGKALKNVDRESIVVNTKFGHTDFGTINYESYSIRDTLERSLKRLQMDYVDSIIIHNPPMEYLDGTKNNHYEILEKLKEEGKIKAYGASLDTYDEMKLLMDTTESKVIEAFFNILHQDSARAFDLAKKKEVGIIVKIPLDSGWLTGKYDTSSTFDDIRSRWSKSDIKTRAKLIEKVKFILNSPFPLSQSAIAFCLAFDAVSTVIPGSTTINQLKSNIESSRNSISPNIVEQLEEFYKNEVEPIKLPW